MLFSRIIFKRNVKLIKLFSTEVSSKVNTHNVNLDVPLNEFQQRILKVSVIGMPNAGKSTFINNLMDRKVCATSSKIHTTRRKKQAIFTDGDAQVIFVDTPGLVNNRECKKYQLENTFLHDSKSTLPHTDIIAVLHDVSASYMPHRLDMKVQHLLEHNLDKPSFLVLNKVDLIKSKRKLLDYTRSLTENCLKNKPIASGKSMFVNDKENRGWKLFQDVFMVSSLTGEGLEDVRNYLVDKAKPGNWLYPPNIWSDQRPEDLVLELVKGKFLDYLPQELGYELETEMELFEKNEKGVITTAVNVYCPNQRKSTLIAGQSNGRLHQITAAVQQELQNTFQTYVRIRIMLLIKNKE